MPLDINDEDIEEHGLLRRPRASEDEAPTMMTGAIHVIKLRRLWSRMHSGIYHPSQTNEAQATGRFPVEQLRQELEEWRASTPRLEAFGTKPLSVFASPEWFQLAYDHSLLLLYRPYVVDAHRGKTFPIQETSDSSVIDKAFHECYDKAREMCMLYRRLYQNPTIQFTWGSVHILFLGGLTYLFCLWRSASVRASAKQNEVISTCMACSTVLVIIAERWKLATSYRDIFQVLSERTIAMVYQSANEGNDFFQQKELPNNLSMEEDWLEGLGNIEMPQESDWLLDQLLWDFGNT